MSKPTKNNMVKSQAGRRLTRLASARLTDEASALEQALEQASKKQKLSKKRVITKSPELTDNVSIDENNDYETLLSEVQVPESQLEIQQLTTDKMNEKSEYSMGELNILDKQPSQISIPIKLPKVELKKLTENSRLEDVDSWLDQLEQWCMRYQVSNLHNIAVEWAWANARVEPSDVPLSEFTFQEVHPLARSTIEEMLIPVILMALPPSILLKLKTKRRRLHIIYREILRMVRQLAARWNWQRKECCKDRTRADKRSVIWREPVAQDMKNVKENAAIAQANAEDRVEMIEG
eukprot:Selendium_serpulae@DN6326_c2_g3_i4.p1